MLVNSHLMGVDIACNKVSESKCIAMGMRLATRLTAAELVPT